MDVDPERSETPAWRDPLSVGFRAHRHLLLLRLRWHERRDTVTSGRRPHSQGDSARSFLRERARNAVVLRRVGQQTRTLAEQAG